MNNKTDFRTIAKNIRKNLDIELKSALLVEKLRGNPLYKNSKNVMIYYPFGQEINLLPLLADNKNFYLPRVNGDNLEVCPYKAGEELQKSTFKIYEPVCDAVSAEVLDLVIVPALMADKNGYRLGYGGGFYDRFLSCNPDVKTLLPIAKELIVDDLPHDYYDVKIDCIIYT